MPSSFFFTDYDRAQHFYDYHITTIPFGLART